MSCSLASQPNAGQRGVEEGGPPSEADGVTEALPSPLQGSPGSTGCCLREDVAGPLRGQAGNPDYHSHPSSTGQGPVMWLQGQKKEKRRETPVDKH